MPYPKNAQVLSEQNAEWVFSLYQQYLSAPDSVDESWSEIFNEVGDGLADLQREETGASWGEHKRSNGEQTTISQQIGENLSGTLAERGGGVAQLRQASIDSIRAIALIRAYRRLGHYAAKVDPLDLGKKLSHSELDPETYGFSQSDCQRPIFLNYTLGFEWATMDEILEQCRKIYCSSIGAEIMHILDPRERAWLLEKIEGGDMQARFTPQGKHEILKSLLHSEMFEHFLNKKFIGTKRFGLDGGESLIPLTEQILKRSSQNLIKEITFGMPHRGRLNMLAHIMHKPHRTLLAEFQGISAMPDNIRGGDMKYHLGTSQDREFDNIEMHLSLVANPSHLEAVNTVVLGKVRAKQQLINDKRREQVMGVLIHGDAAFAGQGVVPETLIMSQLRGYRTGGTIHIIVNNQIGFTTTPNLARSSPYCSDVAKMIAAPIFHVNGDDPEACTRIAKLAVDYRQKFSKDVIIDMWCYRRFGHNEIDEPKFTQPLMYQQIEKHPTACKIYQQKLLEEGSIDEKQLTEMQESYESFLEQELKASTSHKPNQADWLGGEWTGLKASVERKIFEQPKTGISRENFDLIGKAIAKLPDEFEIHPRLKRLVEQRGNMIKNGENIDWACAEALALGSLLVENAEVRFSGEDCQRGTFSQRHAVFIDQKTENHYISINHIKSNQGKLEIINSPLSEFGVLGYEYGYSLALPHGLVVWEAQFGDFANGAQVIIDQFIASGEAKWLRMSGLVMLLPHGYEGQGPEHSSARVERFLELCAEENMQVCNISSPANYFHAIRRQLHRDYRKPLIIMSPKSLLRRKLCVSTFAEMAEKTEFKTILDDQDEKQLVADKDIRRVVISSGKISYDILETRRERKIKDVMLLRLEQLYPFPAADLLARLERMPQAQLVWLQEEPKNMGAWRFLDRKLEKVLDAIKNNANKQKALCVARPEAASPATGRLSLHKQQELALINEALDSDK